MAHGIGGLDHGLADEGLEACGIGLGFGRGGGARFFGRDAAGDEERIEAFAEPSLDIGFKPVADGENAGIRDFPPERRDPVTCKRIDGRPGLAEIEHLAAHFLVEPCQRAGAIEDRIAVMDDDIGIGAEHLQAELLCHQQGRAVIIRGFGAVIHEAGAEDALGLLEGNAADIGGVVHLGRRREEPEILLGPDVIHLLSDHAAIERDAGGITGGGDVIPGICRHLEARELGFHIRLRAGGICEQDHDPAAGAEIPERRHGLGKGAYAIVQAAPEIAQERIMAGRDFREAGDDLHGFPFRAGFKASGWG